MRTFKIIIAIILLLLLSTTTFAQTTVGVMTGRALNVGDDMIGISLNQRYDTIVSVGIAYMTPIENLNKGKVMVNSQYHFEQFSLGGGIIIGGHADTKPFAIATVKPLKEYPIRFFFNYSKMRKTVGIIFPLIKISQKDLEN
tara:strand:- start:4065 stop:4490 length:426 start_codon:yes stop_codon:yes gene_type:complete